MTYLNGDKYVGSWKLGSKNGYGKYYYKDGSSITSIWINGKFDTPDLLSTNNPSKPSNLTDLANGFVINSI